MMKSVSGCERSRTQRNAAFRSSAAWPSMLNKPKKIGIWIIIGKHPPTGFTPCSL